MIEIIAYGIVFWALVAWTIKELSRRRGQNDSNSRRSQDTNIPVPRTWYHFERDRTMDINKIKIPEKIFQVMRKEIETHKPNETILFLLATKAKIGSTCLYLVTRVILLDDSEAVRNRYSVEPTKEFSTTLYSLLKKYDALAGKNRLITVHSHPFCSGKVSMSGVDDATMITDQRIYEQIFGKDSEFLSVVFNADLSDYDGYVVSHAGRQAIDEIAVIGSGIHKINHQKQAKECDSEMHSRTKLIPGFDLSKAMDLRIGVVGAGGLGACVITALTLEGFAEKNQLVIVDSDRIDASNLVRIPYATKRDTKRLKVDVAKDFVKSLCPDRNVLAIDEDCYREKSQSELANCDVLICGVDSELARQSMNHLANNFLIPLIDIGSSVIVDELLGNKFVSQSGQARIFVPGATACLLCNMGIDSNRVNNELTKKFMTDEDRKLLEKTGYLHNYTNLELPQPSVYSLNSMIAAIGMSVLKKYVFEGKIDYNWINANFGTTTIFKEKRISNPNCPVCGKSSTICEGKVFDINTLIADPKDLPEIVNDEPIRTTQVPENRDLKHIDTIA